MARRGVYRRAAMISVVLLGMGMGPTRAMAACPHTEEADARAIRDFQTMLMVTALRCARQDPAMLTSYNLFVAKTRPVLAMAGATLRKGLVRIHGPKAGERAYDSQVTAVANEQSLIQRAPDWCAKAAALATDAAGREPAGLAELARQTLTPSLVTASSTAAADGRCSG